MGSATPLCRVGAEHCSRIQVSEIMGAESFEEDVVPVDAEPRDVSEEPRGEPPGPMSMRRRAAIFVMLLGGVLAVRPLIEASPDERRFVVVVANPVERVEVVWRDGDGEVLRQLEQRFPGEAPASLQRILRLEPGRYQLDIATENAGRRAHVTRTVDVLGDTSEITVEGP